MNMLLGVLGAAACLAAICGIGNVLAHWLRAGEPSDARPARPSLGWAFLLGSAAVGLALQIPLAIDGRITHRSFAAVAIVGAAALAWTAFRWWPGAMPTALRGHVFGRRFHSENMPTQGSGHGTQTFAARQSLFGWLSDLPMWGRLLAVVALPAALFYCCRTDVSGYDARSIYALKARVLYDSGTIRGEDFQDIDRVHFNPSYPLLVPLLEAQVYWTQGGYSQPGLKLLFLLFPLSLASIYAGAMRRFSARGVATTLALMLLLTPIFLDSFEGASLSGSADLPLAALIFAAVLEISRWIRRPGWRSAVCAAILLGAAAATKAEGMVWVAACAAGGAGTWLLRPAMPSGRQIATALAGCGVLVALLVLRQAILRQLPDSPYYPSYFAALDWQWIKQLGDRPMAVLSYGLAEVARAKFWNLMWPCILGSLVLLRRGRVPAAVLFWRLAALAGICAALFALVITPLHLEYELRTSFTRLMLHAFPLASLIMSEQLAASGWSGQLAEVLRTDEPSEELDITMEHAARAA